MKKNLTPSISDFEKVHKLSSYYEDISGPGLVLKIKRFLLLKFKYIQYILARKNIFSGRNLKTNLFFGKSYTLPAKDIDAYATYFFGALWIAEAPLTKFFIKNINEDTVFYDIGANYGFYSCLASEFIKTGQVHSFEPNPEVFVFLEKNTKDYSNLFLNKKALGSTAGDVSLFSATAAGGYRSGPSSIIESVTLHDAHSGLYTSSMVVPMTTLDNYVSKNKKPTILKIDVEGAELQVIEGGTNFFKSNSPLLVMEVWGGDRGDIFSLKAIKKIIELGYINIFRIDSDGNMEIINDPINSLPISDYENWIFKK